MKMEMREYMVDKTHIPSSKGFTLLELLVVIAILLLVSVPVFSGVGRTLDKFQAEFTIFGLQSKLKQSHQRAWTQQKKVVFHVEPTLREWIGKSPSNVNGYSKVKRIVFYADGSSSGGAIRVGTLKHSVVLSVDKLSGKVREISHDY